MHKWSSRKWRQRPKNFPKNTFKKKSHWNVNKFMPRAIDPNYPNQFISLNLLFFSLVTTYSNEDQWLCKLMELHECALLSIKNLLRIDLCWILHSSIIIFLFFFFLNSRRNCFFLVHQSMYPLTVNSILPLIPQLFLRCLC